MSNLSKELTVVKSNSFVQASYSMSLDEMRILSLTLGVFNPENPTKRDFEFTVDEFCQHFPDVDPKSAYTQVQNAIRKISRRWMTLRDDEYMLDEVVFVTDRTYFKKEGRFRVVFHERLMPYIAELHNKYTTYQLKNISEFASLHSIRIYELCSQYRDTGWRHISLESLKDWLGVKDKYPRYNSFNQRVLEPSISEINAKSDLMITVEPIKRGRSVVALDFVITSKQAAKTILQAANLTKDGLTKLPQRPQVKAGSHAEGEWAQACLRIRKSDWERLKSDNLPIPDRLFEQLADYSRKVGNIDEAKRFEKLLSKGKTEESITESNFIPTEPLARFYYLWNGRTADKHCWGDDKSGDTREKLEELFALSQTDGVSALDRKQVESALKRFKKHSENALLGDIFADIKQKQSDFSDENQIPDEVPELNEEDREKMKHLTEQMNQLAKIQMELMEELKRLKDKTA